MKPTLDMVIGMLGSMQYGEVVVVNQVMLIPSFSRRKQLCESGMRENRPYRLRGGRRRALKWVPPPIRQFWRQDNHAKELFSQEFTQQKRASGLLAEWASEPHLGHESGPRSATYSSSRRV